MIKKQCISYTVLLPNFHFFIELYYILFLQIDELTYLFFISVGKFIA